MLIAPLRDKNSRKGSIIALLKLNGAKSSLFISGPNQAAIMPTTIKPHVNDNQDAKIPDFPYCFIF